MPERRFRRIPFESDVQISTAPESWTCDLLDIAMKGALVGAAAPLPLSLGQTCNLCITLPGSDLTLEFQAEMVHQEDRHYGFKFISENLETLIHLRKLIELNTGDVEATRAELTSWLNS